LEITLNFIEKVLFTHTTHVRIMIIELSRKKLFELVFLFLSIISQYEKGGTIKRKLECVGDT
jgi:hypothetical protein